ncbi:MAG: hypothetical protein O7E50_07430 [Gemmatimonadetes bacterium]|nr:hypothetical protein [Gemmatimonadota bacterium]
MLTYVLPAIAVMTIGGMALRMWYRSWRRRRIAARRRVEAPNSHYSSKGVRNQEDRERWGDIRLPTLHPLNQEEVVRLLETVDVEGVNALSGKDRLFLDNMTIARMSY